MFARFALLALSAFASAAPHALEPAELVANGLIWTPSMEDANNESAWSELARRQFKVATLSFAANPKQRYNAEKTRVVPAATAPTVVTPPTTSAARSSTTSTARAIAPTSTALLTPMTDKLNRFYSLASQSSCDTQLDTKAGGFKDNGVAGSFNNFHYCGDRATSPSVIWWRSNMDIDCDGSGGATGPCANDPSFWHETAFEYKGKAVDAQAVPFVVINDQAAFRPSKFGLNGFEVVGVLCGGQLTWAVFADTNGLSSMGEGFPVHSSMVGFM